MEKLLQKEVNIDNPQDKVEKRHSRNIFLICGIFLAGLLSLVFIIRIWAGNFLPAILPSNVPQTEVKEDSFSNFQEVLPTQSRILKEIDYLSVADGFSIGLFVKGIGNARDLEFSDGGVLVASIPSEGKVVALPDKDLDGGADQAVEILLGLNKPHGIAFFDGKLFVVEETRVSRYLWNESMLAARKDKELFSLPRGGRHTTRSIVFDKMGKMYVSIGSRCDVCFEEHPWIGSVIVSDSEGRSPRIFSKGLRNAVFITVDPVSDKVWVTEMGRDFLGDNLPPDEINILADGGDYGWPVCYGNKVWDRDFAKRDSSYCSSTIAPVYEIPAHSAPLGLTFVNSKQFPTSWQGDLLVLYHGSWNRSSPIGYKVVRLDVEGDKIIGSEDFVSGFLNGNQARGRPVDVIFDSEGSLFISDDKAGVIYKLVKQ